MHGAANSDCGEQSLVVGVGEGVRAPCMGVTPKIEAPSIGCSLRRLLNSRKCET